MKMPPPPPKFSFVNRVEKQGVNVTFHLDPVGEIACRTKDGDIKHRPRADSLDIRRSSRDTEWYVKKAHSDPSSFSPEESGDEVEEQPVVVRRRRSASCSVPSSSVQSSSVSTFDPILEEPVGHELQRILEGDS